MLAGIVDYEKTLFKLGGSTGDMGGTNMYSQLGVMASADSVEIEQAWQRRQRVYPKSQYPEHYEAVKKAYETLIDQEKREMYDKPCLKLFNLCAKRQPDGSFLIQS